MQGLLQDYADKYATMLTGRDIAMLFEHLKNITSRSEAARICELERRTTYYWQDNKEMRFQTKRRVLQALLEKDYLFTLKYLCEKTFDISNETIDLYLKTIYENAMNPDIDPESFKKLVAEFYETRIKYAPSISASMNDIVSDLSRNLLEQATTLNVPIPKMPLATMTAEEVVNKLPYLIRTLPIGITENGLNQLEGQLNLPRDLIKLASDVKTEVCSNIESHGLSVENTALNPYGPEIIPIPILDNMSNTFYFLSAKVQNEGVSLNQGLTVGQSLKYIT